MSNITNRVAKLSPEKLELLMRRLQEKRGDVEKPRITRQQPSEAIPLSFAQQRLWFIDQLEPNSVAYSIPAVLHLDGSLVIPALEHSLNEISRRHEALRTTFQTINQVPVQTIAPHVNQPLKIIDLTASDVDPQTELQQLIEQPFDLAQGPVWFAVLLRLNETTHKLFLNIHHIVFDDWSLGLFLQELATLYEAILNHQPSPLAELPIQYSDFTVWQRDRLQGEGLETLLNYWKQQLADAPSLIELPLDRPRAASSTYRSARQPIQISRSILEALKKLARQEDATLFMTLFAAFATLLHRYTQQTDLVIGSPIANRNQVETENLIGFFVNTLALRANLAEASTFRSLLNQVRKTALSAYAHQDLPFEKLVEELQPERHPGCNPLVQTLFVLQTAPKSTIQLPNLDLRCEGLDSGFAKFDLLLELQETADGIEGWFEYKSDLFDAATIARMVGHFQTLLQGIVANPDQALAALPLLTPAEHALLTEWSNVQTVSASNQLIHQVFEQQAAQTPDAIALSFQTQHLTYRDLNQRANQLAHYLQSLGVQPDQLVGICVNRSIEAIVGLLGILKAGAAYVPLDLSYLESRLTFMLEDTQISILVTTQNVAERLPNSAAKRVHLDTDWRDIAAHPHTNPQTSITSENLAYVMYTSGSTGQPKGVCIPHRGVVRLVNQVDYINLDATEVLLQLAPLAFDASTFEIWGALLNGARLAIPTGHSVEGALSLEEIGQSIQHHQVTTLWLTTGLFNVIVDERLEDLKPLRQLITGGDALSISHVQKARQVLKNCKLINGYGPTENTTFTCCYTITASSLIESNVPIGRPISKTQTYILDRHLQPVAIGVAGELYVGGDGLARGYLNQAALTTQCFIPNPFDASQRLYKTGDRARYRSDGNIEFLGRVDRQVKIRGFRIEPSEIEAVLEQHSAVKTAVVVVHEQPVKQLLAYAVSSDPTLTASDLRSFVQQKLPEYMMPAAFRIVETLELTPNGKVDRRSLPIESIQSTNAYAAPQDSLELQLIKIWEQVLGFQPISVQDNFFELGGHSLLAVRLFARIQAVFNQDLPLATLFQAPTIEQLARILRRQDWVAPWSSLALIQPGGTRVPFFCVHGAGGNVVGFQALAQQLGSDQPLFGLQAEGLDGQKISRTSVEAMAAHYVQEIKIIQPTGPYCLAGFSAGGLIALEMAQQLRNQGETVGLLALLDTQIMQLPYTWRDRLALHSRKLAKHGPAYALRWTAEKVQTIKHRVEPMIRKVYFDRGKTLPRFLRSRYVLETNQEIAKRYTPKPYPGCIDYFSCTDWEWFYPVDPRSVWEELAEGLNVYQIPGGHHDMMTELGVQVLAAQLKARLNEVNRLPQ